MNQSFGDKVRAVFPGWAVGELTTTKLAESGGRLRDLDRLLTMLTLDLHGMLFGFVRTFAEGQLSTEEFGR